MNYRSFKPVAFVVMLSCAAPSPATCAAETATPTVSAPFGVNFPDTYNGFYCGSTGRLVLPSCSPQWTQCGCSKRAFNVSNITRNLSFLRLGEIDLVGQCGPSCLLSNFVPLPYRPSLTYVELVNFWVAPDNRPFPVGAFLDNMKRTLRGLMLGEVYLPVVTRETFAGFSMLTRLILKRNRLSTITSDAFASLAAWPGQAVTSRFNSIRIEANLFKRFDWSVFIPVAPSLTEVSLRMNNIKEVYLSQFFTMPTVEWIELSGNQLTRIDDRFLASVSSRESRPYLKLDFNRFCVHDAECGCSALANVWNFFKKPPRRYTTDSRQSSWSDRLTCGNYTIRTKYPEFVSRYLPSVWTGRGGWDYKQGRTYSADNVVLLARARRQKTVTDTNGMASSVVIDYLHKMADAL
ncbi:uncharacterized protein LOC129601522 [Paramacrobiotus metropolitanus]|uniref:uncharacterized protein LOC129601522 n=1 Tax=Paramacrobiotus metropolitanus TaxID=2943436 RepID=UPI002445C5AE|nr:uncharacterized protein LOC129601522 [Paramacrobiotus metropolitanus]